MKKTILLDFTGVYSEYKNKKDYTYVDCRDIKESDRYCSPESEKKYGKESKSLVPRESIILIVEIITILQNCFVSHIPDMFNQIFR